MKPIVGIAYRSAYMSAPVQIVCADNMPFALEAFGTLGRAVVVPGREITPAVIRDADILAIRSTTRVDRELLEGSRVRFVGTATIGTDHMDTDYLERVGIRWCYAPGCNANSVAEYLVAALLSLAVRYGFELEEKTIGVIGVGNVGTLVVEKAVALGMRVLPNDPPRERRGDLYTTAGCIAIPFVSLQAILNEADIVTLHVPLTREGTDATFHMANAEFFARMKKDAIFINCARGSVVDTSALIRAIDSGRIAHAVIDTWEGEPSYSPDLLQRVAIGTPHIAGHSFEGKVMGTVMVYREACRFLGVEPRWSHEQHMPPPPVPEVRLDARGLRDEEALWRIVNAVYDIEADDHRLRTPSSNNLAAHFDSLRRNYPIRREFRFTQVALANASPRLQRKIAALGFVVKS
ncbi:MAG: 4-phosphoerythronate dehydrogenase [Kiritimatiellae bacterium]|nr:4-phosphoerythronate dehydrogenase [Kiritimatiellia bacterium]